MSTEKIDPSIAPRAHWRDPESYQSLLDLDRIGWAGNGSGAIPISPRLPVGRQSIASNRSARHPHAGTWSLNPVSSASRSASHSTAGGSSFTSGIALPATEVFWRPDFNPSVLVVEARPLASRNTDVFDIRCFASLATVLCCGGYEHVLFSDGMRHLQLTVATGSVLNGPVRLHYLLSGLRHMETKALALQRLCGLCHLGRLPRGLFPPERRAKRWAMMLRAWDGEAAGANRRQVAAAIFGKMAAHELWESGYRARMQRLVREAGKMIGGGYRTLLQ